MGNIENRPKVGLGVMIKNNENQVLLGLRKSPHGQGTWCFPGGHLEFGEKLIDGAAREALEETGLVVSELELISVQDELRSVEQGKHYVGLGFLANKSEGKAETKEPEKFEKWQWFDLDNLPTPLFEGTELMLERYRARKIFK
jgi:8-oxo-dGTP diphosphatase